MMYCPAEIMVLPALNKVKPNYACSITAEDTVSKEKGASSDIRKIRDYIYGEDTRFIHWASSAKLGKLMMREFAQEYAIPALWMNCYPQPRILLSITRA